MTASIRSATIGSNPEQGSPPIVASENAAEVVDEPEPRDLAHFVREVHEDLGQPSGSIVSREEPADELRSFSVRPLEHLEELAGGGFAESGDDASTDADGIRHELSPTR
jgi:hypothetical protein